MMLQAAATLFVLSTMLLPHFAEADHGAPASECAYTVSATRIPGSNAVSVSLMNGPVPPLGTITAYAGDRAWTGELATFATQVTAGARPRAHFTVETGARIEGIRFSGRPACSGDTAVSEPVAGARIMSDPTTLNKLTNVEVVGAPACAHPYADASVAYEAPPSVPRSIRAHASGQEVEVTVEFDERGVPTSTRTYRSSSADLNSYAEDAVRRSRFNPAVFRCVPKAGRFITIVRFE